MDSLKTFFEQEKQRVFTPPADFNYRVMQGLPERNSDPETLWDSILLLKRPILAATLGSVITIFGLNMMSTPEPTRGPTQIYLESELQPGEELLYVEADTPSTPIVFTQLISVDSQ